MKSGEDTLLKDNEGKAITVHCYVADERGDKYYINSYCQAVPVGEGVATPLEDLVKSQKVRVLSPEEAVQMFAAKNGVPAKKVKAEEPAKKDRKKAAKPAAEQPAPEPAEAPENAPKPGKKAEISDAEIKAELEMLMQAIPDKMLADELRRRGFVFSAVKPVVIEI